MAIYLYLGPGLELACGIEALSGAAANVGVVGRDVSLIGESLLGRSRPK
jgi:hypothetical protein